MSSSNPRTGGNEIMNTSSSEANIPFPISQYIRANKAAEVISKERNQFGGAGVRKRLWVCFRYQRKLDINCIWAKMLITFPRDIITSLVRPQRHQVGNHEPDCVGVEEYDPRTNRDDLIFAPECLTYLNIIRNYIIINPHVNYATETILNYK